MTTAQRRELDRILARIAKAEASIDDANAQLDEFLQRSDVRVPAVARAMGLTPQALYPRSRRKRKK